MTDDIKSKPIEQNMLNDDSLGQEPFDEWSSFAAQSSERKEDDFEPAPSKDKVLQEQNQAFDAEDFSSFAADTPSLDSEESEDNDEAQLSSQTITSDSAQAQTRSSGILNRLKAGKLSRIVLASMLCAVLVGLGIVYWQQELLHSSTNSGFIRHPIIVPSYKEQLKFFILADSQNAKSLINMVLTFEFCAVNAHEQFRNNRLAIKDAAYQLLLQSQPSNNKKPHWQKVVDKELITNLKARFPQCSIVSAEVTELENL